MIRSIVLSAVAATTAAVLAIATGCAPPRAAGPALPSAVEPTSAPAPAPASQWPAVTLTKVAGGIGFPVGVVSARDGSDRIFVVEQGGLIRVIEGGTLRAAPVLDVRGRVSTGGERGLLGLAFPPGDAALHRFYVYYTDTTGDIVIARVQWQSASALADPTTLATALTIPHREFANHNGGQIAFGPDGLLYAGIGDGGGAGDPHDRAQNLGDLHGKILRIDVEGASPTYAVPPSNPFIGRAGARGEVYAYGLRNPWRFSFDRATGDLWIGDVGQDAWEEIDLIAGGSPGGQDFGWHLYEGTHPYPPGSPPAPATGLTFPVDEYSHAVGDCVTGGYVYRGSASPALAGIYVFGDYIKGQVFGLRKSGAGWERRTLLQTSLGITSFGEDEAGELYLCASDGALYRITASP